VDGALSDPLRRNHRRELMQARVANAIDPRFAAGQFAARRVWVICKSAASDVWVGKVFQTMARIQ